jgi:hypothetical protein
VKETKLSMGLVERQKNLQAAQDYSSSSTLIHKGYVPRPPWVNETMDSTKLYAYCSFFLYIHTYNKA